MFVSCFGMNVVTVLFWNNVLLYKKIDYKRTVHECICAFANAEYVFTAIMLIQIQLLLDQYILESCASLQIAHRLSVYQ